MFAGHPRPGEARVAELVHAYLAAHYRWQRGGEWRPVAIGEHAPELEQHFPEAFSFGVLSAWNPLSVPRGRDANQDDDEVLQALLGDSGHAFLPAFSSARDRTWREPGWLVVDMEVDAFDALARRFGQLGTLWWQRGDLVRMRMDALRPAATAEHPCVHWLRRPARPASSAQTA